MNTTFKKEIKTVIETTVTKVLEREMMKIRASFLPYVSKAEQKDIEKRYGKPSKKMVRTISL